MVTAFVVNPIFRSGHVDDRDDHDNDEQEPCHSRSVSHPIVHERLVEQMQIVEQQGGGRAACPFSDMT